MKVDQICSRCYKIKPCACPPEPNRMERNKARAKEKGYKTGRWLKLRSQVLKRDRYLCRKCGSSSDLTVDVMSGIDHRKARPADCQTLCRRCHGRKDG